MPIRRVRTLRRILLDRGVLLPVAATVVGFAMIGYGWVIEGRAYLPDLLLQLGSSLVLLVPLVLLGWLLEARMRRAEDQAHDIADGLARVRSQVDDLGEATRSLVLQERTDWTDTIRRAREAPDQELVCGLLRNAALLTAVAADGVRVPVPGSEMRLRFVPDPAAELPLTVERPDGGRLTELRWAPGEPADAVARTVAEVTQAHGPGRDVVMALLDVIEVGVAACTGGLPHTLGPLIELPNAQWAIATDGLHCRPRNYHIPVERLRDTAEDWRGHMLAKEWVDEPAFLEAYDLAVSLYRRG